jgi:hypothetical protein
MRSKLTTAVQVACGPAVGTFVATPSSPGPRVHLHERTRWTSAVSPIPRQRLLSEAARFGDVSYTCSGFASGSSQNARLHFADTHWSSWGQRLFNVSINEAQVLSSFDIDATAGAGNRALIKPQRARRAPM